LNALTGADVLTEDKLFATLDTRSRTLRVGWAGYGDREVVLTDTVGFIRDLPKDLFAAFRATFEEAADADVLLHVVDASDPAKDGQIDATEELLAELELSDMPRIVVFNKSDRLTPLEESLLLRKGRRMKADDVVLVSATHRETTLPLVAAIAKQLAERWAKSAKVPPVPEEAAEADENQDAPPENDDPSEHGQVTTVEGMLRKAGKRVKVEGRA
jgi:GTP-binding protein HflX